MNKVSIAGTLKNIREILNILANKIAQETQDKLKKHDEEKEKAPKPENPKSE